jgi:Ca-activated chloride channel homolog
MLTFEYPSLLLLLLIPVAYIRHFWKKRGERLRFPIGVWNEAGFLPNVSGLRAAVFFSTLLFWAGVVCMIIALSGPSITNREKIYLSRGIDMIIVLDESPSMSAQDFPPVNRFETAREVIHRFIAERENDPIGLVSFGADAALRVPPTLDYNFLEQQIDDLEIMNLGDGTAIGMGIAIAALHLKSSASREKIIILLTDGKNNAGEIQPETAANIAAELGVKIYTIGIGKEEETALEFTDPKTGKHYRGTFQGGFDEDLLKIISSLTGGSYFYAGNPGTLQSIFQAIDSLETIEKHVRIEVRSKPIYRQFIFFGFVLLVFDFFLRKLLLREVL